MKHTLLYLFVFLIFISCGGVKSTQKEINQGNYEEAINYCLKKLAKNKTKEKNEPYVIMLHQAFEKSATKDLRKIEFLTKEKNPENYESIFNLYLSLKERQDRIQPILPLYMASGKEVEFDFINYADLLVNSKTKLSEYLYTRSKNIFNSQNKMDYRHVYHDLEYLEKINPNYKDVRAMLQEAHRRGTDFILVSLQNKTRQVIPKRLEKDLLNFDTYGLNDFWTIYHSSKQSSINYDFNLELVFREIRISPERIKDREIIREKEILDGFDYVVDANGSRVKDSLGKDIKVDRYVNIRCEFYEHMQRKSVQVGGIVRYLSNNSKQLIHEFPLQSEYVFEHSYGTYNGDKRALESAYLDMLRYRSIPFPSNEQMVYDVGKDVKEKLKAIITRNRWRR